MDVRLKGSRHVGYRMHGYLSSDDLFQMAGYLGILLFQLYDPLKITAAAAAASEDPQSLLQHHAGIDRGQILRDSENGDRALRPDQVYDLIDRLGSPAAAHALESVIYGCPFRNVIYQIDLIGK